MSISLKFQTSTNREIIIGFAVDHMDTMRVGPNSVRRNKNLNQVRKPARSQKERNVHCARNKTATQRCHWHGIDLRILLGAYPLLAWEPASFKVKQATVRAIVMLHWYTRASIIGYNII